MVVTVAMSAEFSVGTLKKAVMRRKLKLAFAALVAGPSLSAAAPCYSYARCTDGFWRHEGKAKCGTRAHAWELLMHVDFERGNFAEAAAHGEQARKDYFAADCRSKDEQLIAKNDMRFAKYLSHVDREKALHYARSAAATAAPGTLDPADLEWVALLEAGPAPAQLPRIRRPWLEDPPPPVSEAEVLRHVTWTKSYRKLILPPPEVLRASPDPTDLSPYWVTVEETVNTPPNIEALKLRLPKPTLPSPAIGEAAAKAPSRSVPAEMEASAG